jgi:Transglycosylase-like domain
VRRLWALGFAPALLVQQCDCAPVAEPVAAVEVAWTVDWDKVAWCESGQNWSHGPVRNSAGTFSGGLMIGHQYWKGYGGYSAPHLAPKHVQIAWAEDLINGSYAAADRGWQCIGGPARSGV